jgi:hypothetical protein
VPTADALPEEFQATPDRFVMLFLRGHLWLRQVVERLIDQPYTCSVAHVIVGPPMEAGGLPDFQTRVSISASDTCMPSVALPNVGCERPLYTQSIRVSVTDVIVGPPLEAGASRPRNRSEPTQGVDGRGRNGTNEHG